MSFQARITLKEDNMKNAEIQITLDPNDFNCVVVKKKKKTR